MAELLAIRPQGLYCTRGDFYIDPWQPVDFAVITHGHGDHARPGSRHYLATTQSVEILKARLGEGSSIQTIGYGAQVERNGVSISLHPAGHILGSAQVRLEFKGEVWVVSGDYNTQSDPGIAPFEPVKCHTFVTESTFALPIYRWPASSSVFEEISRWWRRNQEQGKTSVLFAYSLGKAQRLLQGIEQAGPLFVHGALSKMNEAYRAHGSSIPSCEPADPGRVKRAGPKGLVVAPPLAMESPWIRKFGEISSAFASGWMQIRGARRRRSLDRGFVLSDHADWPGLIRAIDSTGAEQVWATHGYSDVLVRWLKEKGLSARAVQTRFEGEEPADAVTVSILEDRESRG